MKRHLRVVGVFLALAAGCMHRHAAAPVCLDLPDSPPAVTPAPAPPDHLEFAGAHPVEFYIQAALQRNPEIMARQRRVAAQAETIPQATTLSDPMVTNTIWPITDHSRQTASGRMPYQLMLSQKYPWFGKLALRGQVAEAEARIALTELAETQLRVVEEVKTAYHEIAYLQRAITITEESDEFLRLYISDAKARAKVGRVSDQDWLRAQVERSKLQEQLIELRRQLRQSQADLAKLLAVSPETDLRAEEGVKPPAVPGELERLYQVALASRPELRGRLEAIFRDQARVELAKLDYYPDVTLGLNYDLMTTSGAISPVADGADNYGFTVGFNLPVRLRRLDAQVAKARHRAAESARTYESARDDTFRMVRRLTVQAKALAQQTELYRKEILPKAEQTREISMRDYGVGKVDALQVLDNWRELLRFRVQLARLEAMLGQTLASLERVVGVELTKLTAPPAPSPSPKKETPSPDPQGPAG